MLSGLIYVHYSPQRRQERGRSAEKKYEEIMAENFPTLDENYKHTHTRNQRIPPSTKNINKTIPSFIKVKILKTWDKDKY